MLGALLITDIHLIRTDPRRHDIDVELRNGLLRYLSTLQHQLPEISLILVIGDVTYAARQTEYAAAAEFLRDIQIRVGGNARILVIPGNHDIDRDLSVTPDQRNWRSGPKRSGLTDEQRDQALLGMLQDDASGPGLLEPLRAYNNFASAYGCRVTEIEPYWHVSLPIDARYQAHLRGMTSVLLSDGHDDREQNRLLLGDVQVNDLEPDPGIINVTLCHHPYTWLHDGERQRVRLRRRSSLHVTGHEHRHGIASDPETGSVHLCAGALQPRRREEWDPRLYGLSLEVLEQPGQAIAKLTIIGARWNRDADGFAQDSIDDYEVPVQPVGSAPALVSADPTTESARLLERIAELAPGDRLSVAQSIGTDVALLAGAPDYAVPGLLLQDAEARGDRTRLWKETARYQGRLEAEHNPFS